MPSSVVDEHFWLLFAISSFLFLLSAAIYFALEYLSSFQSNASCEAIVKRLDEIFS